MKSSQQSLQTCSSSSNGLIPSLKSTQSLSNLKQYPLRFREQNLKKVFFEQDQQSSSSTISPQTKLKQAIISPRKEQEMLKEIEKKVQSSQKAVEEIKLLEKSIKNYTRQLQDKDNKAKTQILKKKKGEGKKKNLKKSNQSISKQSTKISDRSTERTNQTSSISRKSQNERSQNRNLSPEQRKNDEAVQSIDRGIQYLEQQKKRLLRIGDKAINIQKGIKQTSKIQSQSSIKSPLKSPKSISKKKKIETNSQQCEILINQKKPNVDIMKDHLKQSLDYIRSQGQQLKKEMSQKNFEQECLSGEKSKKLKKALEQFSPIIQKSIEKTEKLRFDCSNISKRFNLASPKSPLRNSILRTYDTQFGTQDSLYHNNPSQFSSTQNLKSITELDRLRELRKENKIFSYKKQPKLRKEFMNYICESSTSDSEESAIDHRTLQKF